MRCRQILVRAFLAASLIVATAGGSLSAGKSVTEKPDKAQQALAHAIRQGKVDEVRRHLALGIIPPGKSVFHAAGKRGNLEVLEALLDGGVDPNLAESFPGYEKFAKTLLGTAVEAGRTDLVRLLLERKADPSRMHKGMTLAAMAAEKGYADILPLVAADPEELNRPDPMGWTPLHAAVIHRKTDAVRAALKLGAAPEAKDSLGQTPLHWACAKGYEDIVDVLVRSGANPNARAEGGRTPLMLAAGRGDEAVVRTLLSAGADPDARADNGRTAESYASVGDSSGAVNIRSILLAQSAEGRRYLSLPSITGGGTYPIGEYRLKAKSENPPPPEPGCDSTGSTTETFQFVRDSYGKMACSSHSSSPCRFDAPGEYRMVTWRGSYDWKVNCYKLRRVSGGSKTLAYLVKYNMKGQEEVAKFTIGTANGTAGKEKKKPVVIILSPAPRDQFAFNSASPGILEIDLFGKTEDCGEDITWTVEDVGYSEKVIAPPKGDASRVRFRGLPKENRDFGKKIITATACGKRETVIVEVFFNPAAKNHPGEGSARTPNWFYYWGQVAAGNYPAALYEPVRESWGGGLAQAQYDYALDQIILTDQVLYRGCLARPGGKESHGIDCYFELLLHEDCHKKERWEWWRKENPQAMGFFERRRVDLDGDLVPDAVEERLSARKCSKFNIKSCDGRPYEMVIDVDMNAYTEGWKWSVGLVDTQDWSSCRWGKQWKKGEDCE